MSDAEWKWKMIRIAITITIFMLGSTALLLGVLALMGVPLHIQDDLSAETTAGTEVYTEAVKVSEIVTESVTEVIEDDTTDAYYMGEKLHYTKAYNITEDRLSPTTRMVYFNHRAEVWYSVKEETGHTTRWDIPGKHVAEDGTIRDKDGYICIASKDLPKGHTLLTSLGPGKVYDKWETSRSIGIYTDWREE